MRRRRAALLELEQLSAALVGRGEPGAELLRASLLALRDRIAATDSIARPAAADQAAQRRLGRTLKRIGAILAAGAALAMPMAAAANTTGVTSAMMAANNVGDLIVHPVTGAILTVTAVVPNGVIVTGDLFILTTTTVGAMIPDPANPAATVTIASVAVNGGTGLIERVTFTNGAMFDVVTPLSSQPGGGPGGAVPPLPSGADDVNNFDLQVQGAGGGGGRDGALFVSANSGGDGATGPTLIHTQFGGDITTISDGLPGIIVASIGGNGGDGGDGYLGASGASGGRGGAGGTVNVTSQVGNISTTGFRAHGVVGQSRAGSGGAGGSGFVFSGGGAGGAGSSGGTATVTNFSTITTRGAGAHGVFAQSLGSGAGSGGGSYGIFGSGGAGNTGGAGGQAEAINHGAVTTLGAGSHGVTAQSIGGLGGDAGDGFGLVTFSADGQPGGSGGTAIVRTQSGSQVRTEGGASYGLFAQSVGGGGGSGGLSGGLVALGSGGGTGGNGGAAQAFAQSNSAVTTLGEASHGIFVQSIGGGGGNGGVAGGLVAVGARGDSGGTGGDVLIDSSAVVSTAGLDARGLFAQSIGGGGGNALGSGGLVAIGGSGAGAGGAGTVTVITGATSSITTTGRGADGIFAQSVGGGGGTGSSNGGAVALGGSGGVGGNGNIVSVTNGGLISTQGDFARGVFAQSVGGGGGAGGDSGGLVTLGGNGSAASSGAAVTVANSGAISTAGAMASAIQVQSVGGGGGDGGTTGGVFLTIGGQGASGGGSGLVTVTNSHNLTTTGDDSHGILAQSVGGGGGNGGSTVSISAFAGVAIGGSGGSAGNGGQVDVNFFNRNVTVGGVVQSIEPVIFTTGDRSRGVFAQSVGGGGGNGGFAAQTSIGYAVGASAAVGGRGGAGGLGGLVTVDGDVTILTEGMSSEGLYAQSVGGGGGSGGFALSLAFSGGETVSGALSIGLGGAGGAGGDGGRVSVNSGGAIQTLGDFSTGFVAQSVGGGGGTGGFAVSVAGSGAGGVAGSVSVGVGGSGGDGGDGDTVDAEFDGTILTRGDDAAGALIQSVGGGGGAGGFTVSAAVAFGGGGGVGASVGVGGAGGGGGLGGTVTGDVLGAVQTEGDRSTGVIVQSVGGGGGSGGFAISGAIGGGGAVGGGLAVGLGGSGGGGGAGGTVTGSSASILTLGDQSGGLLVQSVGGGGGSGGFNVSAGIGGGGTFGGALGFGMGGAGGLGGSGGTVTGRALGTVSTLGDQSTGVTVQSIGGGGGSGGFNITGTIGGGGTFGGGISAGLGGAGGGGGDGGAVTGSALAITTEGDQSNGLVVQSVGGGGGSGGFNVSGSIGGGGTFGGAASFGMGGAGGTGGVGGNVRGDAFGAVSTLGDQSAGVIVQSLGGGGGAGAFNVSGGIGGGGSYAGAVSVGLGGAGGGGGAAGEVDATAVGIQTEGDQSLGFLAQSVGGGGGAGGFNVAGSIAGSGGSGGAVSVGLGGSGGLGGRSGRVGATVVGDVTTLGDESDAITAQSLGGGGGSGGFNVAAGISANATISGAINVGIGGSGGGGGDAGAVTLNVTGLTQTAGHDSDGVIAQSVGGGGGSGGFNVTGGIAASGAGAGTIGVGVGGQGGGGGDAGAVTLNINAGVANPDNTLLAVLTEGDGARGVVAQSLGGGGGNGGFNITGGISAAKDGAGNIGVGVGGGGGDGGNGAAVNALVNGDLITNGDNASALLIQSVGGGGGSGGFNVTGGVAASKTVAGNLLVGVGGFGGGGGDAGAVDATMTGDIVTQGDNAFGASIQSLGGGGGAGGFNITGGINFTVSSGGGSGTLGVGVGGFGGDGGSAGAVDATLTGDVTTLGVDAHGILVQSVGGGGGAGGFNITGGISAGQGVNGTIGVGLGGFGGGGGFAGAVTALLNGDVSTEGDRAFGALLQSVGGGGGSGGMNITGSMAFTAGSGAAVGVSLGLGGFGGLGGDGGSAAGTVTGRYVTFGDEADGVVVQSLGGGGGAGGLNVSGSIAAGQGTAVTASIGVGGFGGGGGNSSTASLIRVGDTFTDGANADGIIVQSVAGGGGAGGLNVSGGISGSTSGSAGSFGFGLGGFGGAGGDAGDVSASVTGNVIARGVGSDVETPEIELFFFGFDDTGAAALIQPIIVPASRERLNGSHGVLAQSVGGGGGSGGLNVTGQITVSTPSSASRAVTLGVGGFGGAGGDAGRVDLTVAAPGADRVQIQGVGDDRFGVAAQSIGGGGGAGGINVSGGIAMDGNLTAGVGGFGGAGGLGGDVAANVDADVFAGGVRSRGILVQSIGGGGGHGGINIAGGLSADTTSNEPSLTFGMGGFGGAGNASGNVSLVQNGQVRVDDVGAIGVLVQSVAGGGGSGGMNVAANVSLSRRRGFGGAVGIGGTGGAGADAGNVDVRSTGNIFVNAADNPSTDPAADPFIAMAYTGNGAGLIAQSIGGGGGVGGLNVTGAISPFASPFAIGVGGTGGGGGHAGTVSVVRGYQLSGGVETAAAGLIRTFGDGTDGLIAQSIGGGGGNAGINATFAATVRAPAGSNPLAAIVAVGGSGGDAGNGDNVDVRHNGIIITEGADSDGMLVQSLGGGGGSGTYNFGIGVANDASSLALGVGGRGGVAGSGAEVTVDHVGSIVTRGTNSVGIRAQSIGGGGGDASFDVAAAPLSRNNISLTVGRDGGTGGTGGDVTVTADGLIDTTGDQATGILAQSVGGGGGSSGAITVGGSATSGTGDSAASYSVGVSVGLEGGAGATSGDVSVTSSADITTRGDEARGIHAQSIGGGGGLGGAAANMIVRSAGSAVVAVGGAGGTGAVAGNVAVANSAVIVTEGEKADGVLAQSIGGGGGVGGHARTIAFQVGGSPGASTTRTAAVNVGGTGGTGAAAGQVDVTNTGAIGTSGVEAFGIRAQSIGGGGGVGGAAINVRAQGTRNNQDMTVTIGGSGGTGGTAGAVNVLNEGLIVTDGRDAAGISANSIGGGGGAGGLVLDIVGGGTGADQQSHRLAINIGGSGGTGGTGGAVSVINRDTGAENSGVIVTRGDGAYGIFAQSLGGGGGNGSSIISLTGMRSGSDSLTAGINFGGTGGSGNTGGTVDVLNAGLIDTTGAGAHGILAQSIGGGGGNGGIAFAGNLLIGAPTSAPLLTIGGTGGSGGDASAVTVDNTGGIVTRGREAHGIVAQSIGGGGGNAQLGFSLTAEPGSLTLSNALSLLIGAIGGGGGGTGGAVTVNHSGDITVLGEGSIAIKAESINGGGGTLTFDFSGITGLPGVPFVGGGGTVVPDPLVIARAGGENNSGMNAGLVTVNTTGTFGAAGDNGVVVFNQALGGGGGAINLNVLLAELDDDTIIEPAAPMLFEIALGGIDGVDNNGGDIVSSHSGAIVSTGDNTPGTLIQSIGGGGGRAVIDITTPSADLLGTIDLTLGGTNGLDEAGGDIDRTHAGSIGTAGDLAPATILQSIGGGGGSGTIRLTGGSGVTAADGPADPVAVSESTGAVIAEAADIGTAALGDTPVTLSLGANGGSGLDGGAVSADFTGGLTTLGDHAPALIVQSIGAGGGEVRVSGVTEPTVRLGGQAGASGDGGDLEFVNAGDIMTAGDGSHGVFLQSIGGGGGAVFGDFATADVVLNDNNSGDGGDIRFDQTGDVLVMGDGAYGLIAQSLGGGGGWVDGVFAGSAGGVGEGGAIDLSVSGAIFAPGSDSIGVLAQSLGTGGGGDMTLVSDGLIRGGDGTGAGVRFDGGAANLIATSGSISAISGLAVDATDGDDRVENSGMIIGNVDLGSGANSVLNESTGTFVAFDTIDLRDGPGSTGSFTNAGEFLMGLSASRIPIDLAAGDTFGDLDGMGDPATNLLFGARVINTVALDGDYIQTAAGDLAFDVAFGPYASDRVNVTGNAVVDGTGEVILTWLENSDRVTLFATGGVGLDNGLAIDDTLALDYSILADADGVHLSFVSNFAQGFLNRNGRALGWHMDSAIALGDSGGIGRLMALLGNLQAGDEDIYSAIFTELNPEPLLVPSVLQFVGARDFSDQIFNCGSGINPASGQCVWAQAEISQFEREGDAEYFSVDAEGVDRFRAGFERPLDGNWTVGGAVGYDAIDRVFVDQRRAAFTGDGFHGGLGLRYTAPDGLQMGVALSGGWQEIETDRLVDVFTLGQGESDNDSGYVRITTDVGRAFHSGDFFIRPGLKSSVTALHRAGFTERGLDGLGVEGYSDTDVFGTLNPEIALGFNLIDNGTQRAAISATVGGVFHSDDQIVSPMRLLGSNPDATPAYIATPIDKEALRVGADLRFFGGDGLSLRLNYVGEFGDRSENHSAGLNMRVRF